MSARKKLLLILLIVCFTEACTSIPDNNTTSAPVITAIRNNKDIMDIKNSLFIGYPKYDHFSVCHGNTCKYIDSVSMSAKEWNEIRDIFNPPAASAAEEREKIRVAIARFETIIGNKTGTSGDRGENFPGMGLDGQMDCVDEATNTSVYLSLLQDQHLLKWHHVQPRTNRGIETLQAPHFTAVISEDETGSEYAVDSWFLDNGQPPFVVPLSEWKQGWKPQGVN